MLLSRREALRASLAIPAVALAAPKLLAANPVKFQPGLISYNVAKDWDLPTILDCCQKANIAAVEARTTHKHGIETTLSVAERDSIRKQFLDSGVIFWGSGTTCEFHSPDAKVVAKNVEECKKFLQLVHALGGRGVKVRPNGVGKGMTVDQATQQIGNALKLCGNAASDLGLEIWVEVHGNPTQIPATMAKIMTACDHKSVGVTWNSNPTDVVQGSIAQSFELLKPWIKSCHINDLDSGYPYAELFRLLASIGYNRYTLCEYNKPVAAAQGTEWLRNYRAKWAKLAGV